MAYIGYEDIPARTINYRIVPTLRKFYRADGTYDLFDIRKRQANCIYHLASRNEAGLRVASSGITSFGEYNINGGDTNANYVSTFTEINLYKGGANAQYGWGIHLILKLDNSAGLYPMYLGFNGAKGPVGMASTWSYGGVFVYNISTGSEDMLVGWKSAYNKTGPVWSAPVSSPVSMPDYKDYSYIRAGWNNGSAQGIAYWTSFTAYFIHRYSVEHPLYRYYR